MRHNTQQHFIFGFIRDTLSLYGQKNHYKNHMAIVLLALWYGA